MSRGASTGIGVSCSVHDIGNENIRTQNINQRNQQRADVSDPLRKERTIELNVFTRVDFRLPIEREMISVFTDEHVGQEPGTGHAAFDRAHRRRRLHDRIATRACELGTHLANHFETHGLKLQHLADVFVQIFEVARALWAVRFLRRDRLRFTHEMRWELAARSGDARCKR